MSTTSIQAPGGSGPSSNLEAVQQSAIRKATWRLVPLLAVAYIVNYIDRTNVGFAGLTMNRDLGLSATQFGVAAGIFFLGYCAFEVPSNLALYHFGARKWIARIMISWGIVAVAMALARGPRSFIALRCLLGIAEAGLFPGVVYYISIWFPVHYRARVLAWFLLAFPVSAVVGGPLAAAILPMHGILHLAGWQWLFIIEGLPALICGLIALFVLADSPKDATWLTPAERDALVSMLGEEKRDRATHSFLAALKDPRVVILTLTVFFWFIGVIGLAMWTPLFLKSYGRLSNLQVGLLTAIPSLIGSVVMIPWARQVDRSRKYIKHFVLAGLMAAAGFLFSVLYSSLLPAMIGLTFAVAGISSMRAPFYAMPSRFLTGAAMAGGIGVINGLGTLGGMVGPWLIGWLKDVTGSYVIGMYAMAGALMVAVFLALSLKLIVKKEL